MRPGKPIDQRSALELVGLFVVFLILLGGVILTVVVWNAVVNAGTFVRAGGGKRWVLSSLRETATSGTGRFRCFGKCWPRWWESG
jgi:hypothetical protein